MVATNTTCDFCKLPFHKKTYLRKYGGLFKQLNTLKPAIIKYMNANVQPVRGVWKVNQFIETQVEPIKWAINFDDYTKAPSILNLSNIILNEARRQGMKLNEFNMEID